MSTVFLEEERRFRRLRRRFFERRNHAPVARVDCPGVGRGGQDRPEGRPEGES